MYDFAQNPKLTEYLMVSVLSLLTLLKKKKRFNPVFFHARKKEEEGGEGEPEADRLPGPQSCHSNISYNRYLPQFFYRYMWKFCPKTKTFITCQNYTRLVEIYI